MWTGLDMAWCPLQGKVLSLGHGLADLGPSSEHIGFLGVGDGCCRAVTALLQILECVYQTEVGLEATLPALAP